MSCYFLPSPRLFSLQLTRAWVCEKLDGEGGTWRTNIYPGWYAWVVCCEPEVMSEADESKANA
jgi:hypothetical protein